MLVLLAGEGSLYSAVHRQLISCGFRVATAHEWGIDTRRTGTIMMGIEDVQPSFVVTIPQQDVLKCERNDGWANTNMKMFPFAMAQGSLAARVPHFLVVGDYVFSGGGPHRANRYRGPDPWSRACKYARAGEEHAIRYGSKVLRVAHEDATCAGAPGVVLNGYTRTSREWTEPCARRIARYLAWCEGRCPGAIVHLAPPNRDVTQAHLWRERWPERTHTWGISVSVKDLGVLYGYRPPHDLRMAECQEKPIGVSTADWPA